MSDPLLDSLPPHLRNPHLRPIQPIPIQKDGKTFIALRDPATLVRETMVVTPPAMNLFQHFHGQQPLEEIAKMFQTDLAALSSLVQQMDRFGLLWGPTFENLEQQVKERLAAQGAIPAYLASSGLGQTADECREALDRWFEQTEDPEIESPVLGLIAPHLDYARGWPNYAAAYRCLDPKSPPDRVVLLGTNHHGMGDGVVMTRYGFDTPMGRCPADDAVVNSMVEKLGNPLVIDHLDHLNEHSIQLHIPWIQYRFGNVPVVAALVPDPLAPMIEDDGARVGFEQFVTTLGAVLAELGGKTLFIGSSDLSHVGPQFGEPRPVDNQRKTDVERQDREMMSKYLSGDVESFLDGMRWNKNPTRWCSIGNMAATLMLSKAEHLELLDYRQAVDEKGICMVTSAAIALVAK